ncbi:MAG: hypothetical protein WD275_01425 [Rhodothermales bacterium]
MHQRIYTLSAVLMLASLAVTGCRTYGGYGTERATYQQMERAAGFFDEELGRARADLHAARAAAGANPHAAELASKFEAIVEEHARIVEEQKELLAGLSEESGYRELSRASGAIDTQQQAIRDQYERLLQSGYLALAGTTTGNLDRPYSSIPPFYNRIASARQTLTLKQVLALVVDNGVPSSGMAEPDTLMSADSTAL